MKAAATFFAALLLAVAGQAAVLRGTVVEAQTGKALARTLVVVQPVAGSEGATQAVRTNVNGIFVFPDMPAGAYLVTASRRAFAPAQYGQQGWKSSGVPVMLRNENETTIRIPLPRYGAITGRVVDENDVGLSEHDVIAYRNTRPPTMVAKAATDDRGIYRIFGLEPGTYVVRAATKLYDDGGYLPAFYKDSPTVESARPVEVVLDQDVPDIVMHPSPGRLYTVGGSIYNPGPRAQTTVTLVSDMGSETVTPDTNGRYKFTPVAPGKYELFAQAYGGRNVGITAGFQALDIDRDQTDINLSLRPEPEVQFFFQDANGAPIDSSSIQLLARQRQLTGEGPLQILHPANNRQTFVPGRWEFSLGPNYAFYVAGFHGPNRDTRPGERADGWNEVVINQPGPSVSFVLSNKPATVHGGVANAAGEAVAGVPIFLEAYDAGQRRRFGDLRTTRTDVRGQFLFTGLAPGTYRILSTFEFQSPDVAVMAAGQVIKLEEAGELPLNLPLYVR